MNFSVKEKLKDDFGSNVNVTEDESLFHSENDSKFIDESDKNTQQKSENGNIKL